MPYPKWQRLMSVVASASLLLGSFAPTLAAQPVSSVNVNSLAGKKPDQAQWVAPGFESAAALRETQANPLLADATLANATLETSESAAAYVYIIQFQGEPAALYMGGVSGLDATSPAATGARKLNVHDAAVTAYRNYLAGQRTATLEAMKAVLGQGVEVLYTYDLAYNGVAARLTPDQAIAVANLPGVRYIQREQQYQLHTDVGPQFIGADDIWSGVATGTATKGEGIVVGIIDTGINMDHPSFADIGGDGYDHTNPLGSGNYIGWCNPGYPVQVVCNDKLIGAWGYASNTNTPEDADGHGSHTASTVAGNVVLSATVDGSGAAITRTVSGVAPHANIIAYAACCAGSALQAAIEQIITDSVDVVNYSIGPTTGESNPYTDSNMQGFLAATAAGIFVSVSAGNSGSGASTVGNTAPWVQITAASEHNRSIANSLINMNGTNGTPPANIQGKGFTGPLGARRIVYAGAAPYNNALCAPFAANTFNGEIVVCDRGVYGRVEKSQNVLNAGGGGFVLVNNAANAASLTGDAFAVPGTFISYADGAVLKTWLAGGGVYTASISGYSVNTNSPFADVMAGFSSRGPSIYVPDTIVPSLSAPGVDVLAAYADGHVPTDPEFIMISGTSMASPHAAGAGALLRALYPTWTPAQIKSALMMASYTNMRKEDAVRTADPFDRGSGRIVVDAAANVGFVMDETAARFTAANPSTGGNPANLNLPSVAQDACFGTCTWTRVIKSVWGSVVTYTTSFSTSGNLAVTVSPATFALNPGQVFTLTITANTSAITTTNSWNMGDINFWPVAALAGPELGGVSTPSMMHMPAAVRVPSATLDATLYVPTARDSGANDIHGQVGSSFTATAATIYGLADPQTTVAFASGGDDEDWDTNPLDPAFGWFLHEGVVPANLGRWMVSTSDSTVADLDLAVLIDLNNDGTFAWPGERVATSASSSASEVVDLINLQAHAGKRYLIAVYNWSGEADADFNVNWWAAVPTTGDLTLSNFPASLTAGQVFTPTLAFNHYMEPGKQYYGLVNFGSPTSERAIGSTLININRTASEVSKSVWPTLASVGEVVTYTIVVQNRDVATRTYMLTDVLPAGVTYVPGSLTGPATYNSGLNAVTFSTTLGAPSQALNYVFEDSLTNPDLINTTPLGEYVDLATVLGANPNAFGDDAFGSFNTLGCNIDFYGTTQGTATAIGFSSNGLFYPRRQSGNNTILGGGGGASSFSTTIPSVITPNTFIAAYWDDLVITPTAGIPTSGYLAATFGACPTRASVIQIYNAYRFYDSSELLNYQIQFDTDHPGEYWVLYGNISGTLTTGSLGVESFAATNGTQYVYGETPANKVLTTGRVIHYYRPIAAAPPVTVTFQATITNGTNPWITNIADYTVNAPNTSVMHPQAAVGIRGVPAGLTTDAAMASATIFAWNTVTATVWDAGNAPVASQPVTFTLNPSANTWLSSAQPSVAWLKGTNEVPANASAGTGVVTFTYNANTRMLTYIGSVQGLSGTITAAHIHTGTAGVAGPVLVPLSIITGSTSSPISGTVGPLSAASVLALYNGGLYVNVHSSSFPGGELRGQLYLYTDINGEAALNVTSIVPGNTTVTARSWWLQNAEMIAFTAWQLYGPVVRK